MGDWRGTGGQVLKTGVWTACQTSRQTGLGSSLLSIPQGRVSSLQKVSHECLISLLNVLVTLCGKSLVPKSHQPGVGSRESHRDSLFTLWETRLVQELVSLMTLSSTSLILTHTETDQAKSHLPGRGTP